MRLQAIHLPDALHQLMPIDAPKNNNPSPLDVFVQAVPTTAAKRARSSAPTITQIPAY